MSVKKHDTITAQAAEISEIFVSIQGEGLYCGQKQVFLRFAGCNLKCVYCDEPAALKKAAAVKMSAGAAAEKVIRLARKSRVKTVSITGGEPLLNREFIKALAPVLEKAGLAVHLETNGTLYRELEGVKGLADVIAMDIKLPSSTGGRAFWAEHAKFLAVAPGKTFVKTVVTSRTSVAEFRKAVNIVARAGKAIPFFIQPVTAKGGARPLSLAKLDVLYRLAAASLDDLRILPQLHKLWGIK